MHVCLKYLIEFQIRLQDDEKLSVHAEADYFFLC